MYDGLEMQSGSVKSDAVTVLVQGCMPTVERVWLNYLRATQGLGTTSFTQPQYTFSESQPVCLTPSKTHCGSGPSNLEQHNLFPTTAVLRPSTHTPVSVVCSTTVHDSNNHVEAVVGEVLPRATASTSNQGSACPPILLSPPSKKSIVAEQRRLKLDTARCPFTQKMSSCYDAFPFGVFIDKEDHAAIELHILNVHRDSMKLISQWRTDSQIAPGLHFHITPAGQARLDKGKYLDSISEKYTRYTVVSSCTL